MQLLRRMSSATLLLIAGCGAPAPEDPAAEAQPAGNRVLLDYAERPLEKARDVQDLNRQRKGELDEDIAGAER